jgi:hypothetical protein
MALSDLAVFQEQVYDISTEVAAQNIDLFNQAARGTIVLRDTMHQGDYNETAYYGKISGLVRRRNAYGSGAVAAKQLGHKIDVHVKVAAGTPPIELDTVWWKWIARDPAEAAAALGKQMAVDMLQDMLNTGVMAGVAALSGNAAIQYDATGDTPATMTLGAQNNAAAKFGDKSNSIVAWIMHSAPSHKLIGNSIAGNNGTQFLFRYETLNILADPFGRIYVVSDIPALHITGTPDTYNTLGLQPGAITVDRNADFEANVVDLNGNENITRTYQAQWTYNVGVYGYAWDKAAGGHSPTDAALAMSTNWDQIATDIKNTAGVLLLTQ